jgi:hypothetical protein
MNARHIYWGIVLILLGFLGLGFTLGFFSGVSIWALIGSYFLIATGLWLLIRPRTHEYGRLRVEKPTTSPEEAEITGAKSESSEATNLEPNQTEEGKEE